MHVDIASTLCLDKTVIAFDEFTSVVYSAIARVSVYAIKKMVFSSKKKFTIIT
jgi:hypothetical protein